MDLPLATIESLYGLKLEFVEKVVGGFLSDNYVLTDGITKYFLKRHRHTNREVVESIGKSEHFFADGGTPVILPVPSKAGGDFFEHQSNFYSLYPFVKGRHISRGTLSVTAAKSLGETLAHLHKRGKGGASVVSERFHPWDKGKFYSRVAAVRAEIAKEDPISNFGALVLKNLELKERCVEVNSVTYDQLSLEDDHLLHGDYFCDNVFFNDTNQVSYVFDFEKAQLGPALFEMFRSLLVSFLSMPSQHNLEIAREYLRAYLAVYPFDQKALEDAWTVLYLKQIHSVWIEEEHYIKHSTRPDILLPDQYAQNNYHFLQRDTILNFLLS